MSDLERTVRCHVRAAIDGQVDERVELAARVILADIEKQDAESTDWRPTGDVCLSEIVADRIRMLRYALGLNRAQLSARYNEMASDGVMSENILTNIESGRTNNGAARRRLVNVDEVVVFAKALGVTPSALMDPKSTGAMAVVTALKSARNEAS